MAGLVIFDRDTTRRVSARTLPNWEESSAVVFRCCTRPAAQDPLSFGMTRMFSAHAEGDGEYQTFDSEDSAREWLKGFLS